MKWQKLMADSYDQVLQEVERMLAGLAFNPCAGFEYRHDDGGKAALGQGRLARQIQA